LKVLATTGAKRSPTLPDVPTISESGLPGYQVYEWNGLFAPAGTSAEIIEKINKATIEVLAQPAIKERLAAIGAEASGDKPQEFRKFLDAERAKWATVIKQGNIRPE